MRIQGNTGNNAGVTDQLRLQTDNKTPAEIAALNGDSFVLPIDSVTIDTNDYLIALMINRASRNMVVTKVDIAGNTTEADGVFEINLGGTFTTTVANGTATLPRSVKSGAASLGSTVVEAYVNDGAGDMTTESNAYIAYIKKQGLTSHSTELSIPGGWIIPDGQSISVSCTKDNKFFGCIHFYFE